MKKLTITAALAVLLLCGCAPESAGAEIKLPILDDAGGSFTVAAAERCDIDEYITVGADVDYVFAETLSVPYDTNVVECSVKKAQKLKKGDVIAVFDSSEFDYEYRNQSIIADSAYSRYTASGSELLRLEYEQEAKRLELIQHKIDECTLRAPYDCIIWQAERLKAGEAVAAGTHICKVAKTNEVYISVRDHTELFAFGMPVTLKFGTNSTFSGTVAMEPDSTKGGIHRVLIKLDDGELERAEAEAGNIAAAGWGSVIVKSRTAHNALCVPEKAVMTYSGETYCYIEENGERVRVPVEAGITVNGKTVILDGLSDGDKVSF